LGGRIRRKKNKAPAAAGALGEFVNGAFPRYSFNELGSEVFFGDLRLR
jgi:hypothetical protein